MSPQLPTLLYVDEDNARRDDFRSQFRNWYAIHTVRSGEEALTLIGRERVQVVISFQRMAGMRGTELLEQIQSEHPQTVRIIVKDAHDIDSIIDALNMRWACCCLTTPWIATEVRNRIDSELEKMEREEGLRENEAKLQEAQQMAGLGYWYWDVDTGAVDWSEEVYKTFGLDPAEFTPRIDSVLDMSPWPEDHKRDQELIQKAIETRERGSYEQRFIRPDGSIGHYFSTFQGIYDDTGKLQAIRGTVQDTTERKRVENALQESEETARALLNATSDSAVLIDKSGRIVDVNASMADSFKTTREALLGRNLFDHLPENLSIDRREKVKAAADTGSAVHFESRWNDLFFENSIHPIFSKEGELFRFAIYSRDVTAYRKLQEQLLQSQKMEAIGQLAGGIAHDFNNLIGGIMGFAEMALDEVPPGSSLERNIEFIVKAADRAKYLVKQILSFSRKQVGAKHVTFINPILKETAALLQASLPSTIELQVNLGEEPRPSLVDAIQIQEVVMNLCTNAAHAMNDKGVIEIACENQRIDKPILGRMGELAAGEYTVITVKDTGHGINDEIVNYMFEPFYTTKAVGEGTGMGLAVVFGVVKGHAGNIVVESTPSRGTTFRIFFNQTDVEENSKERIQVAIEGGVEHILVVDDEEMMVTLMTELLSSLGYSVSSFQNVNDALSCFETNPNMYDLVITDQTMPKMTGLELTRKLLDIRSDIPIVLCTGYSKAIKNDAMLEKGIRGLLMKPIRKKELALMIRRVLNQAGAFP